MTKYRVYVRNTPLVNSGRDTGQLYDWTGAQCRAALERIQLAGTGGSVTVLRFNPDVSPTRWDVVTRFGDL